MEFFSPLVLSLITSCLVVFVGIPLTRRITSELHLYDDVTDKRKIHKGSVSNLGGIAIFAAIVLGYSLSGYAEDFRGYPYFIVAITLLFFTGFKDDLTSLRPRTKVLLQLMASIFIVVGCEMYVGNLYGVLGIYELHVVVAVPLTIFSIIVTINSFNLIDGIDGLAGGIGSLIATFFGIGFFIAESYELAALSLIIVVVLSSFLYFNMEPAKIFMGDTGSLVIGLCIAILAVNYANLSGIDSYHVVFGNTSPVYTAIILVIPFYDTLRVFIRRMYRNKSPLSADKDHIHHTLINLGYSHKHSSFYLYVVMIVIVGVSSMLNDLDPLVVLLIATILSLLLLPTYGLKRKLFTHFGIPFRKSFRYGTEKVGNTFI